MNAAAATAAPPGSASRLLLVRHGRTIWNLERRIQGRTDNPLDEVGREQAELAGVLVTRILGGSAGLVGARIVASPLERARRTAEIAFGATGIDDGLVERHYGDAEGLTVDEVAERWPSGEYPGAEPAAELAGRAGGVLDRLSREARTTVVVGHGAFLRAGAARMLGGAVPRILNGEVLLLDRAHGDRWRLGG